MWRIVPVTFTLLSVAPAAQAQTLIEAAAGRWTTRDVQSCRTRFYTWSVAADEVRFVDQSGDVDIERVLAVSADRLETTTIASSQVKAGTHWSYQMQPNGTVKVTGGGSFVLTKCPDAAPVPDARGDPHNPSGQ